MLRFYLSYGISALPKERRHFGTYRIVVVHVLERGSRRSLSEINVFEFAFATSNEHEPATTNAAVLALATY